MGDEEKRVLKERVSPAVRKRVADETRRKVIDVARGAVREAVERGFDADDVRPAVVEGIGDAYREIDRGGGR